MGVTAQQHRIRIGQFNVKPCKVTVKNDVCYVSVLSTLCSPYSFIACSSFLYFYILLYILFTALDIPDYTIIGQSNNNLRTVSDFSVNLLNLICNTNFIFLTMMNLPQNHGMCKNGVVKNCLWRLFQKFYSISLGPLCKMELYIFFHKYCSYHYVQYVNHQSRPQNHKKTPQGILQ